MCGSAPRGRDQPPRARIPKPTAPPHGASRPSPAGTYTLLCENSFSTGTPTLWRAREAQSRWKNSST